MNYFISIDDYSTDNYKTAKLLYKYNLKATFFINLEQGGNRRNPLEQIKIMNEMGFDIGCHTIDHPILRDVSPLEQDLNIYYAKDLIEQTIGKQIDWFCFPKGKYDELVIQKCLDAGFKYLRTVDVLDTSPIKQGLNKTSVHAYPRKEYKTKGNNLHWKELSKMLIENCKDRDDCCFKFWFHSWEVDKHQTWNELEEVLKGISNASTHLE